MSENQRAAVTGSMLADWTVRRQFRQRFKDLDNRQWYEPKS